MSEETKPLSTVSVVDLEAGRRLVALSLDLRDDFNQMVRRTTKRLSELVDPGDNVVVVLNAEVFRRRDAEMFCRWLWDDAKALLCSVSWSPVTVTVRGLDLPAPAIGGPVGLSALEVWSHGYGPASEEHGRRRLPTGFHNLVRRQLVQAEPGRLDPATVLSGKVAPFVRQLVQDSRQAGVGDVVVVVVDARDARGREILSAANGRSTGKLVRRGGAVIAGAWFPRSEAVRLAVGLDLEVGRGLARAAVSGIDATFVAGGAVWLAPALSASF